MGDDYRSASGWIEPVAFHNSFRILFGFVVLSHDRRRALHFGVTEHPTKEWTLQQMREAFPSDEARQYVLRDRDAVYATEFAATTGDMAIAGGILLYAHVTVRAWPWRGLRLYVVTAVKCGGLSQQ